MTDVRLERQLRYYFSDKNLWKDAWLVNQLGDDCTGFIGAEVIASFNRVQQITSDVDLVVTSLKRIDELEVKEDSLGALEVPVGKTLVRNDVSFFRHLHSFFILFKTQKTCFKKRAQESTSKVKPPFVADMLCHRNLNQKAKLVPWRRKVEMIKNFK